MPASSSSKNIAAKTLLRSSSAAAHPPQLLLQKEVDRWRTSPTTARSTRSSSTAALLLHETLTSTDRPTLLKNSTLPLAECPPHHQPAPQMRPARSTEPFSTLPLISLFRHFRPTLLASASASPTSTGNPLQSTPGTTQSRYRSPHAFPTGSPPSPIWRVSTLCLYNGYSGIGTVGFIPAVWVVDLIDEVVQV
ncbi:hypothetical protein KSP39_PZI006669 [Platanthera zijinensis]|uniref:Uncharacterized protein n=1 Tax=Platanthera zijinensis TaxID=2320716 RepID=A0AAP0G9J4_9ASPA